MLFNYLPGQEEGNVPFVVENGFGDYKKDPKAIGEVVSGWLMSEEVREKMSKKALEASRPSSTTNIAKEIGDLLFGNWQLPLRKDTEDKFNILLKKLMEPVTM
jgi:1,2-diacylglycerol 3-beta-galactosyltransferase